MFGIGFPELVVILIVALLVLGPEGIPRLAREVGRLTAQLRRAAQEVQEELDWEAESGDLPPRTHHPPISSRKP